MKLINFNFTKISVERLKDAFENIKFNTKIDINSISSIKPDFFKIKDELIEINFSYSVLYEPDFAKLSFSGVFILSTDSKTAKDVLNNWKDKKMSDEFRRIVFNVIFKKSNIKALQLEDELGLPTHIPLPTLSRSVKQEEKANN